MMNTMFRSNIFSSTSIQLMDHFLKPVWNRFWEYLNPQAYHLPNEMWVCIMLKLKPYELLQLSMTSKKFHGLGSDDHVWQQLAKRQGLFVKRELSALHEFKLRENFQKDDEKLKYHFASSIGPSLFQLLVENWNKRGQEKLDCKMPFTYLKYGKDVLKIRCKEIASQKKFEMKIMGTDDSHFVFINFRNLSRLVKSEPLGTKSHHYRVKSDGYLFNYLMRLARGDTCGLFLDGKEELNATIELS